MNDEKIRWLQTAMRLCWVFKTYFLIWHIIDTEKCERYIATCHINTAVSSADFQWHVMFDPDDFCSKWACYCPCAGVLHPEAQKDKIWARNRCPVTRKLLTLQDPHLPWRAFKAASLPQVSKPCQFHQHEPGDKAEGLEVGANANKSDAEERWVSFSLAFHTRHSLYTGSEIRSCRRYP